MRTLKLVLLQENMKGLRVLSLFDGISCGMVALDRAEIPVEKYVAYEIDSADFSAQIRKRYYWTNIPLLPYEKSNLLFSDIADTDSEFLSRSIEQYADTIKWSKDGLSVRWDTSGKGYYSQANRAKLPNQKWNTVCANRAESKGNVWLGDNKIRLVTMSELEKLQTLPVGYTSCLKNKEKRGKGIGNGWTVDVIAHILSGLKR